MAVHVPGGRPDVVRRDHPPPALGDPAQDHDHAEP